MLHLAKPNSTGEKGADRCCIFASSAEANNQGYLLLIQALPYIPRAALRHVIFLPQ